MASRRSTRGMRARTSGGVSSFATTPRSHRLTVLAEATSPTQNGADTEGLDNIGNIVLSKSLSIYKASPLCKLSYKKKVLKSLARKISLHVQKVDLWGDGEAGASTQNLIKVTAVPVVGHQDKQSGILVRVTTTSEYGENADVDQAEIFWGLFCKPAPEDLVSKISENFLDLPLVLVKGRLPLIQEILTYFTKQFDCTIEKFHFAPLEMTWLGAMWSGYAADIPCKPLKLVYTPPKEITGLDTLTFSMAAKDVVTIWKCIHDESSDEFLYDEVNAFTKSIEEHIAKYFSLNLAFFTLKSVMITSLYAESSGKIKILSPKISYRILSHILSIIQQEMNL